MGKSDKTERDFLTDRGRALVNAIKEEKESGGKFLPEPFITIYLTSTRNTMVEKAVNRRIKMETAVAEEK